MCALFLKALRLNSRPVHFRQACGYQSHINTDLYSYKILGDHGKSGKLPKHRMTGKRMAQTANIVRFWEWGRKILCVGRNYREHIKELKNVEPTKPLIFLKPTSSYLLIGNDIRIPEGCKNLHHEVELGVVVGVPGSKIKEENAMEHVFGYVLALDMTARDWQDEIKAKGWPWTFAKGFDTSCPISNFIPKEKIKDPHNVNIWLKVNGTFRQQGSTKDMIFTIPKLINFISQNIALEAGDLILTGTPHGVGQVVAGDSVECGIDSDSLMRFSVVEL